MSEYMEKCGCKKEECSTVGMQKVDVCVPVKITPFAHTGPVCVTFCGKPVVKDGELIHCCEKQESCCFTICQTLLVEVPVTFGAETCVDESSAICRDACAKECDDKDWDKDGGCKHGYKHAGNNGCKHGYNPGKCC